MQFVLFCGTMLLLLSAEQDPIASVLLLLPLTEESRTRVCSAIAKAAQGVFVCTIKLAVFHAMFTWLTFSMFGIPFVYTAALVSGAVASLPLIPVWVIALPAAVQLGVQVGKFR